MLKRKNEDPRSFSWEFTFCSSLFHMHFSFTYDYNRGATSCYYLGKQVPLSSVINTTSGFEILEIQFVRNRYDWNFAPVCFSIFLFSSLALVAKDNITLETL